MTDAECAEVLSEFRRLNLGPDLCAALDHAIGRLRLTDAWAPHEPILGRMFSVNVASAA